MRGLVDKTPTEHESVSFDVTVSKPNHQVKWLLNEVEVTETVKLRPKKIDDVKFSLEIDDVLLTDQGPVKCVILNEKGEPLAESVCKLSVKGEHPPPYTSKKCNNLNDFKIIITILLF